MTSNEQRGLDAVTDDIKSAAHQAVIDCGHFTGDGEVERIVEHAIRVERQKHPAPSPQMRVTDEMVDVAAQAYWMEVYGRYRKSQKWPDDVHGRSEELFRAGCRAALNAALATQEKQP